MYIALYAMLYNAYAVVVSWNIGTINKTCFFQKKNIFQPCLDKLFVHEDFRKDEMRTSFNIKYLHEK
ncbi:hypothetical protein T01_7586 [Trichinella spiralis]|uniref:Uncharacterized protein n=1 Tax=Trichinella spiralis TaxID=6334 RepID=A0A0V1AYB6_TRISP|nr:hypothetical protein T01_7586 [Trichinella spiralis]